MGEWKLRRGSFWRVGVLSIQSHLQREGVGKHISSSESKRERDFKEMPFKNCYVTHELEIDWPTALKIEWWRGSYILRFVCFLEQSICFKCMSWITSRLSAQERRYNVVLDTETVYRSPVIPIVKRTAIFSGALSRELRPNHMICKWETPHSHCKLPAYSKTKLRKKSSHHFEM